ncbi:RNA polymerase sigma factor [Kordiimonas aquimaris]|uniref:RNA polymerase sigma factor n=1 Tax=Kordiimonas aquimaris TaxID=707591 RepID=UPI0021CE2E22|nr:RNA polymerase sigma factor [Kordiimonas aquimaris]
MKRAEEDLLVIAAQKGNRQAFEALYRFHRIPLARFAYRICADDQLAFDAVQDAWITLSASLRKLNDPRSFRSWTYKTVRWRVYDLLRKQSKENKAVIAVSDEQCEYDSYNEVAATSDQLSTQLARLSPQDRQIITLFYLEELKTVEIASILEIPIGTVKSRLSRARSQLRQQMTGEE